jgi:hypothetical protein
MSVISAVRRILQNPVHKGLEHGLNNRNRPSFSADLSPSLPPTFRRSVQRFRIISEMRLRRAADILEGLYRSVKPAALLVQLLNDLVNVHERKPNTGQFK